MCRGVGGIARLALAVIWCKKRDFARAVVEARAAAEVEPQIARVRLFLAQILSRSGDHVGAIPQFQAALAIDPESGEARFWLAATLAAMDRVEESLRECLLAIAYGGPADAYCLAANLHGRRGERENARRALRRYLELETDPKQRADAEAVLRRLESG